MKLPGNNVVELDVSIKIAGSEAESIRLRLQAPKAYMRSVLTDVMYILYPKDEDMKSQRLAMEQLIEEGLEPF